MNKLPVPLLWAFAFICLLFLYTPASADNVLVIDAQYSTVTDNVRGRLEAAGHTVTVTTDTSQVPTSTGSFQQVWDLRYMNALTSSETAAYQQFITSGGFAYFTTENPGCCMNRNNSVAALITSLGGGSTQIGPGWAANIESNVNTTYMTSGITVNFAAIAAIVNSQGIPLISDSNGNVGAMSWIGRAGALGSGVTGTIITVADINWIDSSRFAVGGTSAQQQNVTALDDIIRGVVAGTVAGTISASGNGAGATNGNSGPPPSPPQPTTFSSTNANENVTSNTMANGAFTGNGGTLSANSNALTISNDIILNASGMTYNANGENSTLSGVISGTGGITFTGAGVTTITGTNTYTGVTTINSGASLVNNGNIASSSSVVNLGNFTNNGFTGDWINGAANQTNTSIINNTGTMGNGINYGLTFNNSSTGIAGNATNFGTFNNSGTTGAIANNGTFTNNGTTGAIANTGVFTNNGTVGNVNGNTGVIVNTGTMGSVVNQGLLTNTGTIASINNSGVFTTNSTTVGSFTQTSTGSTVLAGNQRLTVSGLAQLNGNLTITNSPTTIGKYVFITGDILGEFSSLTSNTGVLRYTDNTVELWVMPDGTIVQRVVDTRAANLNSMNSLASSNLTSSLGSDCNSFGEFGGCLVVNYTHNTGSGLNSGGVTYVQRVDDNWRLGVFTNHMFNNPSVGNIIMESDRPAFGVILGWNEHRDGIGWGASISGVTGSGQYTFGGVDRASVSANALQLKVTYAYPYDTDTIFTPYLGVRYTSLEIGGYTERNGIFPLSFNSINQTSTDLLAGLASSYRIMPDLTASLNVGILQNINNTSSDVVSTSSMGTFRSPLSSTNYTSLVLGSGLSYNITENHRVGASVSWQQRSLTNSEISSFGVSYTFSF